ncbi:speedy protein A-like isoform X2 [Athalia rosae]|uniref:speedy protein A-like isoform X2 n=1 Tax=Athalia rosae TaxID=37344 RepID=UPI0020348AF5|nr:speedy protein A-like isoform X2 [Athalia rosae]
MNGQLTRECEQRNIIIRSGSYTPRTINVRSWYDELDDFLEDDQCCRIADKYLIAMVFTYFLRAGLRSDEYTRSNFFIALYLAHDMEEDTDEYQVMLRDYIELDDAGFGCTPSLFFERRDKLWERMQHRAVVSKSCCDKVMNMIRPYHKIWSRERHVNHSGASRVSERENISCPNCPAMIIPQYSNSSTEFSPEVVFNFLRPRTLNSRILNQHYAFDFE